jgi:MoxR-like ATPase
MVKHLQGVKKRSKAQKPVQPEKPRFFHEPSRNQPPTTIHSRFVRDETGVARSNPRVIHPMPRAACHLCDQQIEFPEELGGTTVDCPACGARTALPSTGPAKIKIPAFASQRAWARDARPSRVTEAANGLIANIEKVLVGKREQIQLALVTFLSEGHLLLEDVPGVAKTMLARAIALSVDCSFKRIQCTPDLLPGDITGASIYNPKTTQFEFRAGPLFAQVVLADEINRATPRAQAALLEAMAERQVSADGQVYPLAAPFFLIATQNPIDHEGTFPLPEAQLDRFLMRVALGYPKPEEEVAMLQRGQLRHPIDDLKAVVHGQTILEAQALVRQVTVDPKVADYIVRLTGATREHEAIRLGASPRSSLALFRAAQALAAVQGYDFVLPDDVKQILAPVLGHRILLRPESRLRKMSVEEVLRDIVKRTSAPVIETAPRA